MANFTRRRFLEMVGAAGGSAAMYRVASAIGLMAAPAQTPLAGVRPLGGARRRVVILGAGIGGLTAALELDRAGYDVTVLEASFRPGGRNLTLRSGDVVDELGNRQVCAFDDEPNLYMNAGPARIPPDHTALMHYCREFGIQLEVWVNDNRNAYFQDDNMFGGRPVRQRQYIADARGFMSELLAKSLSAETLEQPFDARDTERLIAFATMYGDLNESHLYVGSERAGRRSGGWIAETELNEPFDLSEILDGRFWEDFMHFPEVADQASTMLTVTGGMDNIVKAFMREVGHLVQLDSVVHTIELRHDGVDIGYARNGEPLTLQADYCLNSIPAHLVTGLRHNLPREYVESLSHINRGELMKIGLQASERFWERERIYGGISWTHQDITQIWYPPHGIHGRKGILLGAYTFMPGAAERLARLSSEERIAEAVRQGSKIHPDYARYIENGISVPWNRMNHMMGCAGLFEDDDDGLHFRRLQSPAERHYMIGDQISYHSGWQEGAIRSAHFAIADIDSRVQAELQTAAPA